MFMRNQGNRTKRFKIGVIIMAVLLVYATLTGVCAIMSKQVQAKKNAGYHWPTPGVSRISNGLHVSGYGNTAQYDAIDIATPDGTDIVATKSGTVRVFYNTCDHFNAGAADSGHNDGFGNGLIIQHDDGTWSQYAHMKKNSFPSGMGVGTRVAMGQFIGKSGSSGWSTGPHLHFGLRTGGSSYWSGKGINPLEVVDHEDVGSIQTGFSEGQFIVTPNNNWAAYRIAGGAPIWVSSWDPFGGPQPWTNITNTQFAALPRYPAFGTLISSAQTGCVYFVGNEGRIHYLNSWNHVGGAKPCVTVDQVGMQNSLNMNPTGVLDSATGGAGTVSIRGWAFHNDTAIAPIWIHMYVGGEAGNPNAICYSGLANATRTDVNAVFLGVGNNHGYDFTVVTPKRGEQNVYVYAIVAPGALGGNNVLIGKKTVTITAEKYKINFRADGVPGVPGPLEKTEGKALTIPSTILKRTGYAFLGWSETASSTIAEYAPGGSFAKDANVTLYAVWKANADSPSTHPTVGPTDTDDPTSNPIKAKTQKRIKIQNIKPKNITKSTKRISGKAEKDTKVTLYVSGKKWMTVTADSKGKFVFKKLKLKKAKAYTAVRIVASKKGKKNGAKELLVLPIGLTEQKPPQVKGLEAKDYKLKWKKVKQSKNPNITLYYMVQYRAKNDYIKTSKWSSWNVLSYEDKEKNVYMYYNKRLSNWVTIGDVGDCLIQFRVRAVYELHKNGYKSRMVGKWSKSLEFPK